MQEIFNPVRTLSTTLTIINGVLPLVSVKTNNPIPKSKIFDVMDVIANKEIEAPVVTGDILIENVLELHVDIIATKNVNKSGD